MKQVYSRVCVIFFLSLFLTLKISAQVSLSITAQTNVYCFGGNNGSATATRSGGTGPFTYVWNPTGGTTATAINLLAGTYTCTVTDQFDMSTATATVNIVQPTQITVAMSSNPSTCGNANGSATGIASGGVPPYTYSWSPTGGTAATSSGLASGTYTITVTDSNGCTATHTVVITNIPGPIANAGSDVNICPGGTATLVCGGSGGTLPFTFSWQPGNIWFCSGSVSPPVTTSYTMTMTDANGCVSTDAMTVFVAPNINLSFSSLPATCAQSNGALSVLPSGGVAPYSYLWSNSGTNDTIVNLAAGIYSVNVIDANGCNANGSSAVSNATGPVINFTGVVNPGCYGGTNGSATATVSGNAPPYLYSWTTAPVQTLPTATGLGAGTYFCTVSDTNNCQSSSQISITQPPQFYLGAQSLGNANCTNNGSAYAWASGGIPPYSFSWSNSMTGDTISGIAAGNYVVTATDNTGCSVSGNVTVLQTNSTIVSGRIYSDMNANCIFDAGDYPIANQMVYNYPNFGCTTTDTNGNYQLLINVVGTQMISTAYNWLSPYTTGYCPANNSTSVAISAICDTVSNIDFSRTLTPGMQDLRISMSILHANPRAGFPNTIYLNYYNVGTVPVSNTTVSLVYDSILSFTSSTLTPSINNQAYLEWNTGTLQPGDHGMITVVLQVPTIQNGAWIGRPMNYYASINPNTGDQTPIDNGDDEQRHVVSSWDPNEKTCAATEMDSLGNITPNDSILSYTIHFQNTGNDTAFNIYVIDTLSPYLDPLTVIPGGSDHPYTFEMSGNGIMRFNFYNIMLPDSNHNEPLSNAFVKYKVKTRPGLPLGTTIDNTAYIYFDFNPAVVTNTTSNTITWGGPLNVEENNTQNISANPNPFDESVTLILPEKLNGKNCEVTLTDVEGRIVLAQQTQNANSITIQRGQLEAGIYFCSVRCEGQLIGIKKLIIK